MQACSWGHTDAGSVSIAILRLPCVYCEVNKSSVFINSVILFVHPPWHEARMCTHTHRLDDENS